jgi:hypothetical protein
MLNFTTIDDLTQEICERLDYGIPDDVKEAIRKHRELFARYEDIDEKILGLLLRAVWGELFDGPYPWND